MSTSHKPAISLEHVDVTYKSGTSIFGKSTTFEALQDISFEIFQGESVGIVGSNGAGKSTLLNILAGIIQPDSGILTQHVKNISLLTLNAGIQPLVSARDNAVLTGMLLGLEYQEISAKIPDIFKIAELEGFEDIVVKNYSTGMKARLGFSIAVCVSCDVLLIDEVLAVGDIRFKKKSHKIMTDIIHSGKTIILVSHNSNQIRELCQRAIWLDKGRVKMSGNANDVMDQYDHEMTGIA
jgi:lipopolysaccharide transport system ATP-binding protein